MSIITNAIEVAEAYAEREAKWRIALRQALQKAVRATERAAVKRATGSGPPGSYPIPVRTGFLRRSIGAQLLGESEGLVFATADYAWAIHTGDIAVGHHGKGRKNIGARPFLEDAITDAEPGAMVIADMAAAL